MSGGYHWGDQSATRSPSPLSGEGSLKGGQTPQQLPPSDLRYSRTRNLSPQPGKEAHTPTSRSPSQSRAASPLRRLQWAIHRAHAREDPFVPVDPFKPSLFGTGKRGQSSECPSPREPRSDESKDDKDDDVWVGCLPLPVLSPQDKARAKKKEHCWRKFASDTQIFLTDTLPRQAYLILLLGLPAIYWSRVARVFEDAELSRPDVQRMIDACAPSREGGSDEQSAGGTLRGHVLPHRHTVLLPFPEEWNPPYVSPALVRFKHSWELFVDSLLREWKTLNLVSALLCTAILTMFQVQDAEDDPVTRTAALFGLIFALMSLSYGCVYIVQFGTMRSMDRASRWAEEAQKTKTAIMWNIWVLLAAPAIWLAWSMIAFCVSILSYVWRTGSVADQNPPSPLTDTQAVGVRVALSVVFALGLLQFAMIVHTFRSYHGARRVREDQVHRGRERERREQGAAEARRGDRDSRVGSSSVVGLGLTGIDENLATPALAGVVATAQEQAENEKMEYLSAEKGRRMGRISPKL
ncbi:hypothetical protein WOLCODRAFT_132098 [Wolfiporia cocos MD-104 SS10]|uniref:Uncharacterized protein n=1 Tax=Wolfiporia cocos (strain MD-104) TaxID=742152 RepID=A0A2H3JHR5_WOLCO|nr:hypothetical protein WOLCODRAFT_132098 [Wolfiporia cocos MD-104 SS10]